ncbi:MULTISPECIES: hypothetical protein [unclassified Acinetobacter]|uniref:hypothetical protein n=1 Tax=unclassified Acinetobacter TaxID=196816 RepID=UPI001909951E|nr:MULTISPECIES: hypothetical protein [unclassified Acinetobacter]MBK0064651.1 hypothetical protein [Acinetobacter sp. S55]MBK0067960.1 hypothetical protein [Acinetobacter sp. S54]
MFVFEEVFKEKRSSLSPELDLRLQRALSWVKQAGQILHELEAKLLYNWIALNTLYIQDIELNYSQQLQQLFLLLNRLVDLDHEGKIMRTLTSKLNSAMQPFLESPYLSYHFWQFQHQKLNEAEWQQYRLQEKTQLKNAIQQSSEAEILNFIFSRIAMLQTQMNSGGMMNQSQIFRQLIDSACQILTALLPVFMHIMLENAQDFDGRVQFFPIVQFS